MPGNGGIVLSRHIRRHHPNMGTILVSAMPDARLAREGIGSADRFVAKQEGLDPLVDAIEEVLHKKATDSTSAGVAASEHDATQDAIPDRPMARIDSGPLSLDLTDHHFRLNNRDLHLTPTELVILTHLARHPNHPFTKHQLSEHLNARLGQGRRPERIPVIIHGLRLKLEPDPTEPRHLITKRGAGYYWDKSG